ncbi:hypothetical protein [Aeromonas hydrophila]|uniref:hypothetical protein n=1 Tax=Aeromonas hydrophila TaxID=644 RepID=UPI002B45CCB8|nr:hypothetical protein [Aeromonas hydrophila]
MGSNPTSSAIYSAKKAIRKDGLFAIQILAFILSVVGQAIFIHVFSGAWLRLAVFRPVLLSVHCQTITGQPSELIISFGSDLRAGRWLSRLAGSSAATWALFVA